MTARALAIAVTLALAAPAAAGAAPVRSALGVPCAPLLGVAQACNSDLGHRVRSWDGVPLDVGLVLPPATREPPFPLVVILHGWPLFREAGLIDGNPLDWAQRGYAVLTYPSRGFGQSCGFPSSRTRDCARGWTHLADARYEVRDTQELAGRLADEGVIAPTRIGVTGASYGGQSYMLAVLKDRIMTPDGRLVPWRSPRGTPMRIVAAAPEIGWTSLVEALVPTGGGPLRVGVPKRSWLDGLFGLGDLLGFIAPAGADPTADMRAWFALVRNGDPYDPGAARALLDTFARYHGALTLQDRLPPSAREAPAPLLAYNSWTDDLFPADQSVAFYRRLKAAHPRAEMSMVFADGFGHPRASLLNPFPPGWAEARRRFFDRYLKGEIAGYRPAGVVTFTHSCSARPPDGPFRTETWGAQTPRRITRSGPGAGTLTRAGGGAELGRLVDPLAHWDRPCRVTSARPADPGALTRELSFPEDVVMIGSPSVRATLSWTGDYPQLDARLWDLSPTGTQTLVTRGTYAPHWPGRVSFSLYASGWRFRAGHRVRLELPGRDAPATQASNTPSLLRVGDVRLTLSAR